MRVQGKLFDKQGRHVGDVSVPDTVAVVVRHDTRLSPHTRAFALAEAALPTVPAVFREVDVHYLDWNELGLDGEPRLSSQPPMAVW